MPRYVVRYDLYRNEEMPVTYADVPPDNQQTAVEKKHILSSAGVDKSYQNAFDYRQASGGFSNIKELNKLYLTAENTAYQYDEAYQRDMLYGYHIEAVIDMRSAIANMDAGESLWDLVKIAAVFVAAFVVGLVIIIIYGAYKTRKYLRPVEDITNLVSQINESNLSRRIDVETARYELKELVMTINSMLDRVYAGYAKQKLFVSDVSHELRTPISVVAGYANMLKRWARDDEAVFDESVHAIIEEADNMKYLVDNLLFLVRSDNNTINYDMERFDLSGLLRDVFKSSLLVDNNKHNMTEDIADDIAITGDRARIKQAARIFIENAIKYTPPMGNVTLSLKKEDERAVITIADSGIGISKKDMAHIFKRFYRGDKSRNRQAGGYGLGLPIARSIINAHGGKIRLRSRENAGTIIDIILNA
jgi:signal transduction histidine kinase